MRYGINTDDLWFLAGISLGIAVVCIWILYDSRPGGFELPPGFGDAGAVFDDGDREAVRRHQKIFSRRSSWAEEFDEEF